MKSRKDEAGQPDDLFRLRLENIINMRHELVRLAGLIDWERLETHFTPFYSGIGRPAHPIRLLAGLHLLKHIEGLSDEAVCERWERDPYMQYFCGEVYFQHRSPIARSDMSHFRKRVGEEALTVLLQESLAAAHKSGALDIRQTEMVAVDTTVQEKAIAFPTDHGLLLTAIQNLVKAAKKEDIKLRQSYLRVTKQAAIMCGRYRHARQMKRAKRQIKFMQKRLGRLIRDIRRKAGEAASDKLEMALSKAQRIKDQIRSSRPKADSANQKRGDANYLYSWHAPEVECISKGKARAPYEFGVKVSLATNLLPAKGGHFILHAKAIHGRPYDGHTLTTALEDIQKMLGRMPKKVMADKGYKGHKIKMTETHVYLSGQKRGVTKTIKRWLKRRAVVEPVIGHAKNDGLLGCNWLKGSAGDKINATLAAAGFNFRQILRYLY